MKMRLGTGSVEQRRYGDVDKKPRISKWKRCVVACATKNNAKTSDLVRKGNVGAVKLETGGIHREKF